jgi:alpha-glucosidase
MSEFVIPFRLAALTSILITVVLGPSLLMGRTNDDDPGRDRSPGAVSDPARDDVPTGAPFSVERESERSFKLTRGGAKPVRVTFLTATTFRIHALMGEPTLSLPDYMRVRSDDSYPSVEVKLETRENGATLSTSAVALDLLLEEESLLVRMTRGDEVLARTFRIDFDRRTTMIDLAENESIYGFGDKRAALDQRGQRIEIINRDAFASENNESYKSIPFYTSSRGYGLFFHNFYPSVFDVGSWYRNRLRVAASAGDLDFYVFVGGPKEVLTQYTDLTGRPAMLPRWAFGYHQAKASYGGRDAFRVAREMRRRKLPVDVIYYDGWDEQATSKRFIDSLWSRHRVRLTYGFGMPMFGRYPGNDDSELLKELGSRRYLMVDRTGTPSIAADQHVDGSERRSAVGYLDYFSPEAVDYIFQNKWDEAIRNGAILGMVDFGELDHINNTDAKFWPSLGMSVAQTRNLYGLVYPQTFINQVLKRNGGGRITGMVRPGFAGTQRLGWSTTGDSVPTYKNFRAHTRGMINLTLTGFSNVGQDIGGWDRKGPDVLYARWFAAGAFHPFMWSHGQGDHEPYAHGEEVEAVARDFLNLRYQLVPFLYSLHEQAHRTGVPMLRALALQEPADVKARKVDDQFFIGNDLLVAPLFNDRGDRKLYLPAGLWYDFFDEESPETGDREIERKGVPLNRLPVYVRAGAIIPLGPVMQRTGEKPLDHLTVNVYGFGANDQANNAQENAFELYEDDGASDDYQKGRFERTRLHFEQSQEGVTFTIAAKSGNGTYRAVGSRAYTLRFHGLQAPSGKVLLNGKAIPRADGGKTARGGAHWQIDDDGHLIVSIPRTSQRSLDLKFASAPEARED